MNSHDGRASLQRAFERASELQPAGDFAARLRDHLRSATEAEKRRGSGHRRWLALVAGMALAVGLTGWVSQHRFSAPLDALAADAVGDHWNCGLKNRPIRTPIPLEQAAERFDPAYRVLLSAPPDDSLSRGGVAHVLERHSCSFGTRRFGHVILEYHNRIVSLLLTQQDDESVNDTRDAPPRLHGRSADGYGVVSVHGAGHTVLLVSDIDAQNLVQLSEAISAPVIRQLGGTVAVSDHEPLAALCGYPAVTNLIVPSS